MSADKDLHHALAAGDGAQEGDAVSRLLSHVPLRYRRRFERAADFARASFVPDIALIAAVMLPVLLIGGTMGGHFATLGNSLFRVAERGAVHLGLAVSEVQISGQRETEERDILDYLGISENTALPFLNAAAARDRVLVLPWIASASVRKYYPGIVQVAVIEREPYAIWQRGERYSIVDRDGAQIIDEVPDRLAGLPRIYGHGAADHARALIDALEAYPGLRSRLAVAEFISLRRWTMHLDNGVAIMLPEEGLDGALKTLMDLDAEKGLLARNIEAIDLRIVDRVVVRLNEGAATERRDAIREGQEQFRRRIRTGGDA